VKEVSNGLNEKERYFSRDKAKQYALDSLTDGAAVTGVFFENFWNHFERKMNLSGKTKAFLIEKCGISPLVMQIFS